MRRFKSFVMRFLERVNLIVSYAVISFLLFYNEAYAQDIKTLLDRIRSLLIYGANILGPGIGLVLIVTGFLKLRRKDDDPRAASQAVWYIVAGVGVGLASFIFVLLLRYFGAEAIGTNPESLYYNPLIK